jgi:putative ATPase
VIAPLLSRCRVITLQMHSEGDILAILDRALKDPVNGLGACPFKLAEDARMHLVRVSEGDARVALNSLEIAATLVLSQKKPSPAEKEVEITLADLEAALQRKALMYDKSGEEHYNLISALHKSLRGSDPDASLYWLARMLLAGEDPFYIARRMVRFASEDVGNADPQALTVAMSAMEAFRFLGHPEGELALAQAAVYLATAPKSNRVYSAYGKIQEAIRNSGALPVPLHIRNAPTDLMKTLGYAKDYKYAHDYRAGYVPQDYLPEKLQGRQFYFPTDRGFEKIIKDRLQKWQSLKDKKAPEKK